MEEEIDLRQYIAVLIKYWYWIVGLGVAAAIIAFGVSSLMAPTYQATALVTATQPRYRLQFDSRFQTMPEQDIQQLLQRGSNTYATLAASDEMFEQLVETTGWDRQELQNNLQARSGEDPNLLALTVKGKNAEEVAQTANTWAEIFVEKANTLYGGNNEKDLEQIKQQQESVAQALAQADAALTTFREESGFGFDSSRDVGQSSGGSSSSSSIVVFENNTADLSNFGLIGQRLQTKNKLLTDYEAALVQLRQMQREIELLSKTTTADSSPVLVASLLSEMINAGAVKDAETHQIQLDSVDPVAGLADMEKVLASRITAIEAEVEPLRADIAALQVELAAQQGRLEQLTRERDVIVETYETLSRKVQEAQLETFSNGKVKIASLAVLPTEPVSSGRLLNTVIAGVLGLMIGVFGAFAWEWWREGKG
ncbi:MAG: hypothetical protein JW953_23190 [Anaerolineae bacterium]|nr:hypothetical protein [Anaerolineae bacterium]